MWIWTNGTTARSPPLAGRRHPFRNIGLQIHPCPVWHGNLYLDQSQSQKSQSLFLGSFCRPHVHPEVPGEINDKALLGMTLSIVMGKKICLKVIGITTTRSNSGKSQLTDMRLRNIMLDSGTPFLTSKEIAWTAEFPE
jgi:hypothetical protein